MDQKIVTIRKIDKLYEVIRKIVASKDKLYLIRIDSQLVEKSELIRESKLKNDVYIFSKDNYQFVVNAGENAEEEWYSVCSVEDPNKRFIYFVGFEEIRDALNYNIEMQLVYIRRWGSKTKIEEDEE